MARDRRADQARARLREAAPGMCAPSTTSPPPKSTAPPRSRRHILPLWFSPPSTIRRRRCYLPGGEALDERYFGLHHDLAPERIAGQLGGTLVWKRDDDGMWIALIRFNRQIEARWSSKTQRARAHDGVPYRPTRQRPPAGGTCLRDWLTPPAFRPSTARPDSAR